MTDAKNCCRDTRACSPSLGHCSPLSVLGDDCRPSLMALSATVIQSDHVRGSRAIRFLAKVKRLQISLEPLLLLDFSLVWFNARLGCAARLSVADEGFHRRRRRTMTSTTTRCSRHKQKVRRLLAGLPPDVRVSARRYAATCAAAFRFLRQPSRPNAPRPVAKRGRAAGMGVTSNSTM